MVNWLTALLAFGSDDDYVLMSGAYLLAEISHSSVFSASEALSTPEPATIALLGVGLIGLAGAEVRRRRKKKAVNKS